MNKTNTKPFPWAELLVPLFMLAAFAFAIGSTIYRQIHRSRCLGGNYESCKRAALLGDQVCSRIIAAREIGQHD